MNSIFTYVLVHNVFLKYRLNRFIMYLFWTVTELLLYLYRSGMWVSIEKKNGNVVLLAGNRSLANSTATTRPLTNSTVCMLTVKISRPLRQLHVYFETSRPLSHHANWLPHVRVPRMGTGLYLFTVCAQCQMTSRLPDQTVWHTLRQV